MGEKLMKEMNAARRESCSLGNVKTGRHVLATASRVQRQKKKMNYCAMKQANKP